jgi:hypothetical protein
MNLKFLVLAFAAASFGCAHSYHYVPEVEGNGATHAAEAVIYAIPTNRPIVKIEMVSPGMGVPQSKSSTDPKVEMMQIRIFFQRSPSSKQTKNKNSCDPILMMPHEQLLQFTDGTLLQPSVVHATAYSDQPPQSKLAHPNKVSQTKIQFSCRPNHAVELFYTLPKTKDQATEVQSFVLISKIRYRKDQVAQQKTRFDRVDSHSHNSVDPSAFHNDQFYPYDYLLPISSEWIGNDWYWLN